MTASLPRRGPLSMQRAPFHPERTARFRFARMTQGGAILRVGCGASDADDQPADPQAAGGAAEPQQGSGAAGLAAKARRLHPRLYDDAEEAELGLAQGCQGA